jgi:hypothetical protein
MAKRSLQPVSIWGIEFDALVDETKSLSATVPAYPVESGFPVSDTIILDPISISMTLYVSNTPVTWLYRHGSSMDRVNQICELIERKWLEKELAKIVTSDTIYTDMGITSLSIKKSREIGYAREISISAQKIRITRRETAEIPDYILKSGKTQSNAGTASTSTTSEKPGAGLGEGSLGSADDKKSDAKKGRSILYGVADGLGFI